MACKLITRVNRDNTVETLDRFNAVSQAEYSVFQIPETLLRQLKEYVESEIEYGSLSVGDIIDEDRMVDPEYFHSQEIIAELLGHLLTVEALPNYHTATITVYGVEAQDEEEAEKLVQQAISGCFREWDYDLTVSEDE
jgi:hypothetical protein